MVILLILAIPAAPLAGRELDRTEAESRLEQVTREIGELKNRLEGSRADHRNEQARLRKIDLDLQQANLELRALEKQRIDHLNELESLERKREVYLSSLDQRLGLLADQIRSA